MDPESGRNFKRVAQSMPGTACEPAWEERR